MPEKPLSRNSELLSAYRNTDFVIKSQEGELIMRCDENNDALDEVLGKLGKAECAFITAHNPGSVKLDVLENAQRQERLMNEVERLGYGHFPGRGVARDGRWEPEESLLILGIPRIQAQALGRTFGQIAIVVKELGRPAELILCS